jgi:two-component sensor histidine kinase/PAS domain-containing protein
MRPITPNLVTVMANFQPLYNSQQADLPQTDQLARLQAQNAELERQLDQLKADLQQEKAAHSQTKSTLDILKEWLTIASEADGIAVWRHDTTTGETTLSTQGYILYGLESGTFKEKDTPFPGYQHPFDTFFDWVHPDDRGLVRQADEEALKTGKFKAEFRALHPDGKVCWIYSLGKVNYDEQGQPISVSGVEFDITERKQIEDQLRLSLQEKEILLKEIHHRVKNNLQVISSLLSLQTRSIKDSLVTSLFQVTQNRVQTIALLHEHLYQSDNLAQISFSNYIQQLVAHIFTTHDSLAKNIFSSIDSDALELSIDMALPCGLIVNELVTNSLKYAFPDGRSGQVKIHFTLNQTEHYVLTIWDDGIGIPDGLNNSTSNTLGLRLVQALAKQLKGTIELDQSNGNLFTFIFPLT